MRFVVALPLALLMAFNAAPIAAVADGMSAEAADRGGLQCRLEVPKKVAPGQPVVLRMTLRNDGSQPLHVLAWGTPFEGQWFAPFVGVERVGVDGAGVERAGVEQRSVELPYGGAMVKRGDPSPANYVTIEPAKSSEASIDLAIAYDLTVAGHYRVVPRLVLHDVFMGPGSVSRPRAEHRSRTLTCNAPSFDVAR